MITKKSIKHPPFQPMSAEEYYRMLDRRLIAMRRSPEAKISFEEFKKRLYDKYGI